MFVPTFDNDISVLVNHSLDLAEIVRFDALLFCENKFRAVPLKLGHATIILSFYCLSATKIGIIIDTSHVFANYLL